MSLAVDARDVDAEAPAFVGLQLEVELGGLGPDLAVDRELQLGAAPEAVVLVGEYDHRSVHTAAHRSLTDPLGLDLE